MLLKQEFMRKIQKISNLFFFEFRFLPDTGPLIHMSTPQESSFLRVETAVRQGDVVSVYYDPMISKLVVRGRDRNEALRRLKKSLEEFEV